MKTIYLLLTLIMFLLIALTTLAQNDADLQTGTKTLVPYSKKMPPLPELTNSPRKALPGVYGNNLNTTMLPHLSDFNVKEIKKDPKRFMQQMLEKRNSLKLQPQRNNFPELTVSNMNDQHSDFHLTKDINTLTS
jgi:hypothetical protein